MKKYLFLLALCPVLCFAQKREYAGTNIKFAPFALGVLPVPAIQFSVEHTLSRRFSLQGELGYGIFPKYYHEWTGLDDTAFVKPFALKANVELRYHSLNSKAGRYVAFNAFYRHQVNNGTVRYIPAYDDTLTLHDGVAARKSIWGLAFVFGYQKIYRWFVINPYYGFGFMVRYTKTTHREYDPGNGDERPHEIEWHGNMEMENSNLSEYSGIQPYLTIGLRLGYAFRKPKGNGLLK